MNRLIRNATVADPTSSFNEKKVDLFIVDGIIQQIGATLTDQKAEETLDLKGAFLSPGWLDIGAQTGDPGFEHREDLEHVAAAAVAGGYTAIACFPNTQPCIHSKSEVYYIIQQSRELLVDFFPIGAISHDCAGKELTEMLDMQAAGAVAFSDGYHPVGHAGLLLRALLYAKAFGGVILNHPHDTTIVPGGQMHEGLVSTQLGLRGIPVLAETLMVQRDIDLLAYSGSRLHLYNISSARSVALVREARRQGLQLTCSVPAINLLFTEADLQGFDSHLKVLPPLRTKEDQEAVVAGLQDGTIDVITSNHRPLELEAKQLEFPYADFGAIGLETAYAAAQTALGPEFTPAQLADKFSVQPRKILGLPVPSIEKGQPAELTVFDPQFKWIFDEAAIRSKSKNTPFIGRDLQGRVLAVIKGDRSRILTNW